MLMVSCFLVLTLWISEIVSMLSNYYNVQSRALLNVTTAYFIISQTVSVRAMLSMLS